MVGKKKICLIGAHILHRIDIGDLELATGDDTNKSGVGIGVLGDNTHVIGRKGVVELEGAQTGTRGCV